MPSDITVIMVIAGIERMSRKHTVEKSRKVYVRPTDGHDAVLFQSHPFGMSLGMFSL